MPKPRPVLVVLCAAMFLVLLDVSIVNVALPTIARDLGGGTSAAQVVVDGYTVPLAALMLFGGMLSDRCGPRRLFLGGLLVFGLASLICAVAPNLGALLAGRILQGAGAAAMLPASLACLSAQWPAGPDRTRALAAWSGISALAVAVGPLIGGVLVGGWSWRAIFLVNLPVVATAALLGGRAIRHTAGRQRALDGPGAALSVLTLASLIGAVIAVGTREFALSLLLAVLACATGALLVGWERRTSAPMADPAVWRRPDLRRAVASAGVMNAVGNGTVLVVTLFLQGQRHLGPQLAGLAVAPLFAPLAVAPLLAGGRLGHRPPRQVARWAFLAGALGLVTLAPAGPGTAYGLMLPGLVVVGAALGLLVAPLTAMTLAAVPEAPGLAGGLANVSRQVGTSLGVAGFGVVYQVAGLGWCFGIGALLWLLTAAGLRIPAESKVKPVGARP
ncbi:MFS transporter [Calidifontibacter sp. DB0510]|uniref:MFS transporter n=1 Tax=Metallococcus carri TaxID=1656884 RepID=A0A967AYR7_9MICO|nr:MFS transporter [Metallococcus carri]NHN54193.1 MFS transporter [Metallococcus carri]NOP36967.1 MFS transporter [Calidifontibacter sp. DB2511S]